MAESRPVLATSQQVAEMAARQPGSRVLAWSGGGERREGTLTAAQLRQAVDALAGAVVETLVSRPGLNELMLRWHLSRHEVPDISIANYTWGQFAEHYPTFWSKLTGAATTRNDMVIVHAMIQARERFEAGELDSEQAVQEQIYGDMIAMTMKEEGGPRKKAAAGKKGDERALLQRARLRREVLRRTFAGVRVPTEELAQRGIPFTAATSVLHAIREEDERRKAEGGRAKPALTTNDVVFGRLLLRVRAELAKRHGGLPEELDPTGFSYMPTYTRSAQLGLAWTGEDVGVPAELA